MLGITIKQHPLSTTAVVAAAPPSMSITLDHRADGAACSTSLLPHLDAGLRCPAGIIPECSILCYFGSLSEDISSVIDGKGGAHGPIKYVLMGVTCFFMITAVVWSTFVVRCPSRMHGRHCSTEHLRLCNICAPSVFKYHSSAFAVHF